VALSPNEAKPSHEYEQGWTALNELLRSDYSWSGFERNVFYANNRDGTFSDVSGCVDLDFVEDGRHAHAVFFATRRALKYFVHKDRGDGSTHLIVCRVRRLGTRFECEKEHGNSPIEQIRWCCRTECV
jgi:hypothetical protein